MHGELDHLAVEVVLLLLLHLLRLPVLAPRAPARAAFRKGSVMLFNNW